MAETEIGAKLVLDDHASHALEKMREGFAHVGEKVNEVQSEMMGLLKQTLATAAGFQLDRGIESLKELGAEVFHAAMGAATQTRELTGLLALTDKTGASFDELTGRATELHDELEKVGIEAGVSGDMMHEIFGTIAERSQKSSEEIMKMTEQFAIAGKGIPGGATRLASDFAAMEAGIVRPRSSMVLMVKQAGLMGGSMKQIAHGLSGMAQKNPEKAFELVNKSIDIMAKKMKAAPPTFDQVITSLKGIRENIFEAAGMPILTAIIPHLTKLRDYFIEHRTEIEHFAKSMADHVGVWVNEAAAKIQQGFAYLKTHANEIKAALDHGAKVIHDAFKFFLAHKSEFALALGVKAGAGIGKAVAPAISSVAGGAQALLTGGPALEAMLGGMTAAAPIIAAFAAAAALAGAAFMVLTDDSSIFHATALGIWKDIKITFGQLAGEFKISFNQVWPSLREFINFVGVIALVALREFIATIKNMTDVVKAAFQGYEQMKNDVEHNPFGNFFKEVINSVTGLSNFGKMLDWLLDKLGLKFGKPGAEGVYGEGMDKRDTGPKTLRGATPPPTTPPPVFNGGQTFNIKQDFRDQDPDRIAVIFQRDLGRAAASRIAASTGIFG